MVKEKKILYYFLYWFLALATVCLIGISDVFALEYTDIGYLYDRSNVTIEVTYETTNQGPIEVPREEVIYTQFKVMNVFIDNYQFQANRHYQIEMEFLYQTLKYADLYQVYDENDNSCSISYTYSKFTSTWALWDFSCPYDTNRIYLKVYNSSNTAITDMGQWSWNYTFLRYTNAPIDSTESENTDKIINNNNENTDKIIESNKETQEIIKEQFNSCRESNNLFNENDLINGSFNDNSTDITSSNNYKTIKLSLKKGTYTLKIYEDNIYLIRQYLNGSITRIGQYNNIHTFTLNEDGIYQIVFRKQDSSEFSENPKIQINSGTTALEYEKYGEICTNKLDDIQGALTDSSTPNLDSLEDSIGWLPPGPVDSILNLPLTMLNSLTNSLSKTCSPLNLTLPYVNSQIQIPCLSTIFAQITGVNGLWTWVGTIASVLILYNYLLNLYAWVDRVLTLRAEFDEAMGADLANWGRL